MTESEAWAFVRQMSGEFHKFVGEFGTFKARVEELVEQRDAAVRSHDRCRAEIDEQFRRNDTAHASITAAAMKGDQDLLDKVRPVAAVHERHAIWLALSRHVWKVAVGLLAATVLCLTVIDFFTH